MNLMEMCGFFIISGSKLRKARVCQFGEEILLAGKMSIKGAVGYTGARTCIRWYNYYLHINRRSDTWCRT